MNLQQAIAVQRRQESKTIGLALPVVTHEQLKRLAIASSVSVSHLIRILITWGLSELGEKPAIPQPMSPNEMAMESVRPSA